MSPIKIKSDKTIPLPPVELTDEVSIGISAYGNYETTLLSLRSLFHSAYGDFELILVDDCSPDNGKILDLFLQARKEHENTKVFAFTENMEYSGSLNAILSHAIGEHVIFLSNDIFVSPAYLSELLSVSQQNPNAGIVRGVSNFVDNSLPTHNVALVQNPDDLYKFYTATRMLQMNLENKCIKDTYLTGDAFLVTRALLDKIGTLDPLFYGYFTDHDFGLRARISGYDLLLAQGAFAYHKRNANFEYLLPELRDKKLRLRWARVYENWARFKIKYDLPVSELYKSINNISWDTLSTRQFNKTEHFIAPVDYNQYLIS